jgi:hypothetical protein
MLKGLVAISFIVPDGSVGRRASNNHQLRFGL